MALSDKQFRELAKEAIKDLEEEIEGLENEEDLRDEIAQLETLIKQLKGRIDDLEDDLRRSAPGD